MAKKGKGEENKEDEEVKERAEDGAKKGKGE